MRLRVKHQKPNFQPKETVRFGAAVSGIQLRETIFANFLIKVLFSFGYFLMTLIFPNVVKAHMWHYFHFYAMSEGCKILLVPLKKKLYFSVASTMKIIKGLNSHTTKLVVY